LISTTAFSTFSPAWTISADLPNKCSGLVPPRESLSYERFAKEEWLPSLTV
jgi:hypothetical protein